MSIPTGTPGDYYLVVRSCDWSVVTDPDLTRWQMSGGVFDVEHATTTSVAVGQAVSTVVVMSPGAAISGVITRDGVPEPGGCAVWSQRNGWDEMKAVAGNDGRFTIAGITPTVPGVLRACGADAHAPSVTVPMTWYPAAASRWTAATLTPAAGITSVRDIALQADETLSVVVTSLPDATGCSVDVVDRNQGRHRVALRPGPVPGTFVADAFGLPAPARTATLECGGRRAGTARPADERTPGFGVGATENEAWWSPVVEIVYDVTGPVITPSPNPDAMPWTSAPATISFTCSDAGSGVATCPAPVTYGEGQATWVSATDLDGNVSSIPVVPRVDSTPPAIVVTGNGRTFRGDEPIQFACDVRDERSGVGWVRNDCPAWGTPASSLGVGDHTFVVESVDWAGNRSAAVASLTVVK